MAAHMASTCRLPDIAMRLITQFVPVEYVNDIRVCGHDAMNLVNENVATLTGLHALLRRWYEFNCCSLVSVDDITPLFWNMVAVRHFGECEGDLPVLFGPLSGELLVSLLPADDDERANSGMGLSGRLRTAKPFHTLEQVEEELLDWWNFWDLDEEPEVWALKNIFRWVMRTLLQNYKFTMLYVEDDGTQDGNTLQLTMLLWERL